MNRRTEEKQMAMNCIKPFQPTKLEKASEARLKKSGNIIAQALDEIMLSGMDIKNVSPKDITAAITKIQPATRINPSTLWRWRGHQTEKLHLQVIAMTSLSFSEHRSARWKNGRRAQLKKRSKTHLVTYLVGLEALEPYYAERQKRLENLDSAEAVQDHVDPAFIAGLEITQRYTMHFRKTRKDTLIESILRLEKRLAELQAHLLIADQKLMNNSVKLAANKR